MSDEEFPEPAVEVDSIEPETLKERIDAGEDVIHRVSIVLVFGAAALLSGAIVYRSLKRLRNDGTDHGNVLG